MESVLRVFLVLVLSGSAVSAAQYSMQKGCEWLRAATGIGDCAAEQERAAEQVWSAELERSVERATRDVAPPIVRIGRDGWELVWRRAV